MNKRLIRIKFGPDAVSLSMAAYLRLFQGVLLLAIVVLGPACGRGDHAMTDIRFQGVAENVFGLDNVVIHTVDDYSEELIPFLRSIENHKIRSTIFIDRTSGIREEAWAGLNRAYELGNEIGSHSRSHAYIYYPADESTANFILNDYEISGSFQDILAHTAQPHVWSFAYPGGAQYHFASIHRRLKEAGYIAARRYSGFANLNEQWGVVVQDSYDGKVLPQSRFALRPDRAAITDDLEREKDYLRNAFKETGIYHFVTHPKGLDYSSGSTLGRFFTCLDSLENTWFAPLGFYAQYQLLTDSLSISAGPAERGQRTFSLESVLRPDIYIVPLTLVFTCRYRVTDVVHDGNKIPPLDEIPCHVSFEESRFQRSDSLFVTLHPRGALTIFYDTTAGSKARSGSEETDVLDSFNLIADPPPDSKASPVYFYNAFRDSVLAAIEALKSKNVNEQNAREITRLYYKIGAIDSALTYLQKSGIYRDGLRYWGMFHVNLMRLLSTRKDYPALDRLINIPPGFGNREARRILIEEFIGTMYNTLIGGTDKLEGINSEMTFAVYLMNAYNEETVGILSLKDKCLDYLHKRTENAGKRAEFKEQIVQNLNRLGNLCFNAGDAAGARGVFERLLALDPRNALAHYNAAMVYKGLGQSEKAIEFLEAAVAIQPDFGRALYTLGTMYYEKNEKVRGILMLKRSRKAGFNAFEGIYEGLVRD